MLSFLGAILLSGLFSSPSPAHWADLSVAEMVVGEKQTQVTLTIPTEIVAFADRDRNHRLSAEEVRSHQTQLEVFLRDRLTLTNGTGTGGKLSLNPSANPEISIQGTPETHSTLQLTYTWPEPIQDLTIRYDLFGSNVSTARCLATILQAGRSRNFAFTPDNKEFILRRESWRQQAVSFLLLGIEHIFTGYDHILFLVGLLLLGGTLGDLLKIVTAFTVAHSVTLSLSILNLLSLPTPFVESAIALSIVYVAGENLWRKEAKHRWLVTFGFGLIHGLGFAGILKEIDLAPTHLFLSLGSFNLGVEIGQAIIVAAAFFILRALENYPWATQLRHSVSIGAIAIGLFWFVQRAFSPFLA